MPQSRFPSLSQTFQSAALLKLLPACLHPTWVVAIRDFLIGLCWLDPFCKSEPRSVKFHPFHHFEFNNFLPSPLFCPTTYRISRDDYEDYSFQLLSVFGTYSLPFFNGSSVSCFFLYFVGLSSLWYERKLTHHITGTKLAFSRFQCVPFAGILKGFRVLVKWCLLCHWLARLQRFTKILCLPSYEFSEGKSEWGKSYTCMPPWRSWNTSDPHARENTNARLSLQFPSFVNIYSCLRNMMVVTLIIIAVKQ